MKAELSSLMEKEEQFRMMTEMMSDVTYSRSIKEDNELKIWIDFGTIRSSEFCRRHHWLGS